MAATKKSKLYRMIVPLLFVFALVAVCAALPGAYAKYIQTIHQDQGEITSQVMYFESNYLTESGATYTITADNVTITLTNYPDDFRISELDVSYTVTVTDGEGNAAAGVIVTPASGTLAAGSKQSASVKISGLEQGETYTVTARGENGFVKTLSATFTVTEQENKVFKRVEQTEHYVLLTVWTQKVMGDAVISGIPAALIPDNTDPALANVKTADTAFTDDVSFNTKEYASRTYRFFIPMEDDTAYTVDNFEVMVGTTEAVNGVN